MVHDAFPHAILNGKFPFGIAGGSFPGRPLKVKDKEMDLTAFLEKHKLGVGIKDELTSLPTNPELFDIMEEQ